MEVSFLSLMARLNFFRRVEATPVPEKPDDSELVDGKAFTIKHYPLERPIYCCSADTLIATINENGKEIAKVEEPINMTVMVDTISTIRLNDALGYKHAFGAIFGQRNKKE